MKFIHLFSCELPFMAKQMMRIMKIFVIIMVTFLVQVSASSRAQQLSIKADQISFKEVFREIYKQTGYTVLAKSSIVKKAPKVNLDLQKVPLTVALKQILAGQDLAFSIKSKAIIISENPPSILDRVVAAINAIGVKGIVTDAEGRPLPGATIRVKNTSRSIAADINGHFFLDGVDEKATLVISFTGYQTKEIPASKDLGLIKLSMREDKLEDVEVLVSTGYQTLPKERATGSFTQIDNKLFNRATGGDILTRLEGITNGMLFTRKGLTKENIGGQPEIRVRGVNTILGEKQPLIVVDNFPYKGDINALNPNDVESITVLKDAAAASIWGAMAGNGVIVINTKSGRYNQPVSVSFSTTLAIGEKPDLFYSKDYLPASTVMDIQKELFDRGSYIQNDQIRIPLYAELLTKLKNKEISQADFDAKEAWYRNNDLRADWSNLLYQQSIRLQNALSVRGGGNNYRYAFTANYDHNREMYLGNSGSRLNLSLQNTFKLSPNLELTGTIWYTNRPTQTNAMLASVINSYNSSGADIYESLVDEHGNPNPLNIVNYRYRYQEQIQNSVPKGKMVDWLLRPLDEVKYSNNTVMATDWRMNAGLKYKFLKYFNLDANVQFVTSQVDRENYYSPESYYVRNLVNRYTQTDGTRVIPLGGILDRPGAVQSQNQSGRALLSYAQQFSARHSINAIAGTEIRQYVEYNQPGATLYNYDQDLLTANPYVDLATFYKVLPSGTLRIPSSTANLLNHKTTRDLSYFGNASYTFNEKYIASASVRWDGSNLLGVKTNQRGTALWSSGLAWELSKEPFYPLAKEIPYLRLRTTYGSAGNIDRTQTHDPTIMYTTNTTTGLPIASLVTAGNPNLRWEQVNTLNLGADFRMLNNRINGSIEYYSKKSSYLLGSNMVDPTTGVPSNFKQNYGGMKTWGWDIQIGSRNIQAGKFSWTSNLIFNTSSNKITKLKENPPVADNQYLTSVIFEQGSSVDKIYALPWYGLNPQDGSVLIYNDQGQPIKTYNQYYRDLKKTDFIVAGNTVPRVSTSLMNTFEWNGFSLSALIVGRFDFVFRRNSMYPTAEYTNLYAPTYHADYFNRWKNPGDEVFTNVPAAIPAKSVTADWTYSGMYYQYSEALITKGDVIRLQDVNLSYTIPHQLIKTWPIKNLRVYGYARSLGIIWRANKEGLDPDYANTLYPEPKQYSFGLQVDF